MKRNEVTTVDKLQIGDRFYFLNDKNKVVWEKVDFAVKTAHYRTYSHFALLGTYADRVKDSVMRKNNSKGMQPDTRIVFLKSKEVGV
ncbi:hypothetical protein [Sphingobacterium cavernae]|uniref:hypothetical protein n=1 Tax=Sphingobacterium cavernae TaxID=2592657 RepID=UPI0012300DF7|nr:hypothetical protein [Sphingobacterium cavernae]